MAQTIYRTQRRSAKSCKNLDELRYKVNLHYKGDNLQTRLPEAFYEKKFKGSKNAKREQPIIASAIETQIPEEFKQSVEKTLEYTEE